MLQTVSTWVPLGSLSRIYGGLANFGRTVAGQGDFRLPSVSVKDIAPGGGVAIELAHVQLPHPDDGTRYAVQSGDVLVAVRGTLPKVAVAPARLAGVVLMSTLAGIRLQTTELLPEVLAAFLRSDDGQAALMARARSATGQIALTTRDLASLEVPVPRLAVQHQVAALVGELNNYEEEAALALELRRRIAKKLVTGLMAGERGPR